MVECGLVALGRVSVRMLRHYDAIGLLMPASVDARSGYRRYAIEQLPLLLRIAELRDLGVGLGPIADLARADDPDEALRENVGPVIGPLIDRLDDALLAAGRPLIESGIFWYEPGDDHLTVYTSYIAEPEPAAGAAYEIVELPGVAEAATLIHLGDTTSIGESWASLMERVVADGYRIDGQTREVYLVAEGHEPGADWVTELQAPVTRVTGRI